MNRKILFCNILTVMLFLLTEVPLYAQNNIVHAYTPFTIPATGPSGVSYPSHVRNDVISTRFDVKVANVSVPAIRYDNTINGNQGHNMDVARFASNSLTPKIEINIIGGPKSTVSLSTQCAFIHKRHLRSVLIEKHSHSKWRKTYHMP